MNVAACRTPDHGLEQSVVDRFLRKANIELMSPLVRYVDKGVEILLQQITRIGSQVSAFVVVCEASGGNCRSHATASI